jgi:dihydropteroate synthase
MKLVMIEGESTRPKAREIPRNEEKERIKPLLDSINASNDLRNTLISIDTRKVTTKFK